jgi:hypothetical protein
MNILVLLIGIILLIVALFSHALAQANVITKIEREWFERLFISRRAPKNNLNEEGLRYRKQSNLCAIGGFFMIAAFLFLR